MCSVESSFHPSVVRRAFLRGRSRTCLSLSHSRNVGGRALSYRVVRGRCERISSQAALRELRTQRPLSGLGASAGWRDVWRRIMLPASVLGSDTELQSLWVVVGGPSPWDVHQHPRDAVNRQEAARGVWGGSEKEVTPSRQEKEGVQRTQRMVWLPRSFRRPHSEPQAPEAASAGWTLSGSEASKPHSPAWRLRQDWGGPCLLMGSPCRCLALSHPRPTSEQQSLSPFSKKVGPSVLPGAGGGSRPAAVWQQHVAVIA